MALKIIVEEQLTEKTMKAINIVLIVSEKENSVTKLYDWLEWAKLFTDNDKEIYNTLKGRGDSHIWLSDAETGKRFALITEN